MDLFKKKEKGKEILDGGKRVVLTFKSNGKYNVEVTHGAIKVAQKGALNMVNQEDCYAYGLDINQKKKRKRGKEL